MHSKSNNSLSLERGKQRSGKSFSSDFDEKKSVLIANIENRMAEFLRASLKKHSIDVEIESDIFDAIFGESDKEWDCVIMEADEIVIGELLSSSAMRIPILAIVDESTVDARIRALDSGADDCLKSPFAISELVARIRALSRRIQWTSSSESKSPDLHDFEYIKDLTSIVWTELGSSNHFIDRGEGKGG